MQNSMKEDNDVTTNKAMSLDIVFGDEAEIQSALFSQSQRAVLPIRSSGDHMGVRVAGEQVGRVCEADRYPSVASVWDVFPSRRPLWLFAILYVSRQCFAMFRAKVLISQLLYELGVVESCCRSGGLGLFDSNVLSAAATNIQTRLLRLALGLVDYTSLKDPGRLHSSDPS
jgi:hypothetical protein